MIFDIVQQKKDLYAAEFSCIRQGAQIGIMSFKGHMATYEGNWKISFNSKALNMKPGYKLISKEKHFRPYSILLGDMEYGTIFQTYEKTGIFSQMDYHCMELGGKIYTAYPIGLGKQGNKAPVYRGEHQIALIERDNIIRNELYNFHVLVKEADDAMTAILFAAYMYTIGCYRPGEKVSTSIHKNATISTNKVLKSKYDPTFANNIER